MKRTRRGRYAIKCVFQPSTITSFMTDGDQDGDRWEGTHGEAEKELARLKRDKDPSWSYAIVKVSG